uniref:Neurotensin n=1 Tax=Trichosurus vulpecula TaxID=9337 RepID=NEUT_TRIVU|nr:RecName: Full=Neurotensin; Short=NT [Trichosurus vulpecula]
QLHVNKARRVYIL